MLQQVETTLLKQNQMQQKGQEIFLAQSQKNNQLLTNHNNKTVQLKIRI